MVGWCYLIICIVSGPCRRVMMIMLNACGWLKHCFRKKCQRQNDFQACGSEKVNAASGNAAIGSIRSGTNRTILPIWIICIITRLNMVMLIRLWIGRILPSSIMSSVVYIQKTGERVILIFKSVSLVETYGGLRFANPPYSRSTIKCT